MGKGVMQAGDLYGGGSLKFCSACSLRNVSPLRACCDIRSVNVCYRYRGLGHQHTSTHITHSTIGRVVASLESCTYTSQVKGQFGFLFPSSPSEQKPDFQQVWQRQS